MSDPEVPQPEKRTDDDVVSSANEGLAEADAARADVAGPDASDTADRQDAVDTASGDAAQTDVSSVDTADSAPADSASDAPAVDPDLAAFEAAERDHPGTFNSTSDSASSDVDPDATRASAIVDEPVTREPAEPAHTATVADTAYAAPVADSSADTQVVPAEPVVAPAPAPAPQPIFVQAPEAPRPLGNRGTAGAIGLLATLSFAVLYLAAILGLGAISGDVNGENIATAALAPLSTWAFWVPVVVFFIAFWLLGAIINRGRWGKWVIFGIFVAAATYGGYLLGQLFQAPFWQLTSEQGIELVTEQLFAPLAIASFVIARELTVWFGAWVARSGARKTVLNAEAQAEYERTLEAGPSFAR